jgi:hypothetical protein
MVCLFDSLHISLALQTKSSSYYYPGCLNREELIILTWKTIFQLKTIESLQVRIHKNPFFKQLDFTHSPFHTPLYLKTSRDCYRTKTHCKLLYHSKLHHMYYLELWLMAASTILHKIPGIRLDKICCTSLLFHKMVLSVYQITVILFGVPNSECKQRNRG